MLYNGFVDIWFLLGAFGKFLVWGLAGVQGRCRLGASFHFADNIQLLRITILYIFACKFIQMHADTALLQQLAYDLKQKQQNGKGAVVFIGAGCSISGGIPLAGGIIEYIRSTFAKNPKVANLPEDGTYAAHMSCLNSGERKSLFKHFVDQAKVNVTHIYLAQLIKEGYVDYVVTVNFDNLLQRGLSLYNEYPPVYDISILNDKTTASLNRGSIIHLHGQHNGLWQLNTEEELAKVREDGRVAALFSRITTDRPWIVVGYSGEDDVLSEIADLGRFDDGLSWICYKDNDPSDGVMSCLINKTNTEAKLIKGYDSDSFFLQLVAELKLEQPTIFSQPFTFLSQIQSNIVEISVDDDKYKAVREGHLAAQKMVKDAIGKYETSNVENGQQVELSRDGIKQLRWSLELGAAVATENFDKIIEIEEKINASESPEKWKKLLAVPYGAWAFKLSEEMSNVFSQEKKESLLYKICEKYAIATELDPELDEVYYNWGNALGEIAKLKESDEAIAFLKDACLKYSKAIEVKHDKHNVYNNWGNMLSEIAKLKKGDEAIDFLKDAFTKYTIAIEIKPDSHKGYYNWGIALTEIAKLKIKSEAINFLEDACTKFAMAIEIKPDRHEGYYSWGFALHEIAKLKIGNEAVDFFEDACTKYAMAIEIKRDYNEAYFNWGVTLDEIAKLKTGDETIEILKDACAKYAMAIEIKRDYNDAYNNWGSTLCHLASLNVGAERLSLLTNAESVLKTGIELGGRKYNLACLYALSERTEQAFETLEKTLKSKEQTFAFVDEDTDWAAYRESPEYLKLKSIYA